MRRYYIPEKATEMDLATALAENNQGDFDKRITIAEPFAVDRAGFPNFPYEMSNITKRREVDALGIAAEMARGGELKSFVWISPPGGMDNYPKCRFTLVNVTGIDNENVYFNDNRGICGNLTPGACLDLARKLVGDGGVMWGDPRNPEELRSYMIGFKEGQEALDLLAKHVTELEEVWQTIKSGQDKKQMEGYINIAKWVGKEFGGRMNGVRNERDSIILGAEIERAIASQFNLMLRNGGGHGMSNMMAMSMVRSPFETIFLPMPIIGNEIDRRLTECKRCGNFYIKKKGKCPRCG